MLKLLLLSSLPFGCLSFEGSFLSYLIEGAAEKFLMNVENPPDLISVEMEK